MNKRAHKAKARARKIKRLRNAGQYDNYWTQKQGARREARVS